MHPASLSSDLASYALLKPLRQVNSRKRAQLYLAEHDISRQRVVIKLIVENSSSLELASFQHELGVMQALQSSNSKAQWMPLLGHGQHILTLQKKREKIKYMILPFYELGSLAAFNQSTLVNLKFDDRQFELLFNHIFNAINALHQQGWLHLDIKPSNFLVNTWSDTEVSIVLSDFGLAQPIEILPDPQSYTTQGTPKYMSPEQFLGEELTRQTDYYAMGLVFYELLTGTAPYHAKSFHEWAIQHCQHDIPMLPTALHQFQPLIDGLMAKNPDHRFLQSGDVQQAIKAAFHADQ